MKDFFKRIAQKSDAADLFGLDTTVDLIGFENNRLKGLSTMASRGAAVRSIVDGRLGQSYTSDFRNPDLFAERLQALARLGDTIDFEIAAPSPLADLDLVNPALQQMSLEELRNIGSEAVETVRQSDPEALVHCLMERTLDRVSVITSPGVDAAYERMYLANALFVERVEGKNILQLGKYSKTVRKPESLVPLAKELADELRIARNNVPFQPGRLTVILAPPALADILMAFTGSVEAEMVARNVSPLTGKMGEQVLDPRITILDDPHHPDGIHSAPVDDEGTPTTRKALIENGVLKAFLGDRRSAMRLNIPPTGNGFRLTPFDAYKSFSQGVSTDFTNLVMTEGDQPLSHMRSGISYGIEVHQINGILLGDLITGDFSGSLEVAYLIRDGERIGRIKDAMISGNFFQVFRNQLVSLSKERIWSGTFGGCSGAFYLPFACVADMDIAGAN